MANTYYISPTGDDGAGSGTSGDPWATLSHADSQASTGDTIYCQDGTYTFENIVPFSTDQLTVEAVNSLDAIFDGGGNSRSWRVATEKELTLVGLKIYNVDYGTANGDEGLIMGEDKTTNHDGITVRKCWFDTILVQGSHSLGTLFTSGNSSNVFVITSTIFSNVYTSNTGDAAIWSALNAPAEATFTNCTFYFYNTGASQPDYLFTRHSASSTDPILTLQNCIIYNTGDAITFSERSFNVSYDYSDAYQNISGLPGGTGNITSDPLFVDEANDDFRLRQGSPCIDTGQII